MYTPRGRELRVTHRLQPAKNHTEDPTHVIAVYDNIITFIEAAARRLGMDRGRDVAGTNAQEIHIRVTQVQEQLLGNYHSQQMEAWDRRGSLYRRKSLRNFAPFPSPSLRSTTMSVAHERHARDNHTSYLCELEH